MTIIKSIHQFQFPALIAILVAAICLPAAAQQHLTGTLADGSGYAIDVPANWNKTLLLWSHGYVAASDDGTIAKNLTPFNYSDAFPGTGDYLFAAGYAMAGSYYSQNGWAVAQAIPDQIGVLNVFQGLFGTPRQTIAWGISMGGLITAALVQQYPTRFNAALPMCGVVGGAVGIWSELLDAQFAFNTLLANGSLQVVHITDPTQNYTNALNIISAAQNTAQGQARIALVAALESSPGWYDPLSPEPAATDYVTQQYNQFLWLAYVDFGFGFYYRAELEGRAGGNPSFNTGVDYSQQLKKSGHYAEVQALYAAAGLNLYTDLTALNNAPRIAADPGALTYLTDNIIFNGQITMPVLTLHTEGDGLVTPTNESAYSTVVGEAGNSALLKETFIHRAGHCEFTPAEVITALRTLTLRMNSGQWQGLSISQLNAEATALGSSYNVLDINNTAVPTPPQFESYRPLPFLRIYDAFTQ
jgi:pimeloyl-ACP methyl ester carboxylesterase